MTDLKADLAELGSGASEPNSEIPSSPMETKDEGDVKESTPVTNEPPKKRQKANAKSSADTNGVESARSTPEPFQPGYKVSSEILQRRREGRIRAQEKLQSKLDELGIKRTDVENNMGFASIPTIPLINQKNYYTEYVKKDDQIMMIRDVKDKLNQKLKQSKEKDSSKKSNGTGNGSNTPITGNATPNNIDDDDEDDADGDADEEDSDESKLGSKTIVIHPGSSNIRIGLASDIDPKSIPNVIAHKRQNAECQFRTFDPNVKEPERKVTDEGGPLISLNFDSQYVKVKQQITSNFKERMRYYKRRILPQSNETCYHFNKRVEPESIPEHNDVHKLDYLKDSELIEKRYVIGEDALKLESYDNWFLRSPFLDGKFNDKDLVYTSEQDLLGDIELIIDETLKNEFNISKKNYSQYNIMLVIPNLYEKVYVETMIDFFLKSLSFGNISVIQEGLSASFGTGISNGCIVDIGAAQTKICCVDDGLVIPNSRVELDYGGDDITRFFVKNLLASQFPYKDINLNQIDDWKLAEDLKQKYTTFQDANVAIQVYNFLVRRPHKLTQKYEFKCFDEVMVSPMSLFYPTAFVDNEELINEDTVSSVQRGIIRGKKFPSVKVREVGIFEKSHVGSKNDNIESKCQNSQLVGKLITSSRMNDGDVASYLLDENDVPKVNHNASNRLSNDRQYKNMTPLDLALIESIAYASYNDSQKAEKLYSNILLVGGSSLIDGLDSILIDRMHIWRSRLLSCSKLDQVIKLVEEWKNEHKQQQSEAEKDKEKDSKGIKKKDTFKLNNKQLAEIRTITDSNNVIPIEILSSSKEIDPSVLVWKGASVYSRLKIAEELWISQSNWDLLGSRAITYSTLFNY